MGEIAIRNTLFGENLFILAADFSPEKWLDLVNVQFSLNKADAVFGGWIDIFDNSYNLRLYFLDNSGEDGQFEVK
jgi:hypothetical protein